MVAETFGRASASARNVLSALAAARTSARTAPDEEGCGCEPFQRTATALHRSRSGVEADTRFHDPAGDHYRTGGPHTRGDGDFELVAGRCG